MGKLLMAAEFHDPAELSLLNAEALAPGDMRWPYYSGTCTGRRGTFRKRWPPSSGRCGWRPTTRRR